MDPLSDLLRVVRLDGAFFYAVEAAEPWSVEAVAARDLLPRIVRLSGFTRQLAEESRLGRPGADCALIRLAEVMFIGVLRRHRDDLPPGDTGWLAGLRDEVVGRALTLIHDRTSHPWTLAELARESACSRSALAKRFALLIGQPPMQYLAQ